MVEQPCNHFEKIKLICLYENCEHTDLLMCKQCFYQHHSHPENSCVRVDYVQQSMAPYIRIAEKKESLEQQLVRAIELKKKQFNQYMDQQLLLIKTKHLDSILTPEMNLFDIVRQETISSSLQPLIRQTLSYNHGVGLSTQYSKLDNLKMLIDKIQNGYKIVSVEEENNKRAHCGIEVQEKEVESKRKKKAQPHFIDIEEVYPYPEPPANKRNPQPQPEPQPQPPPIAKPNQYNYIPVQESKGEEQINDHIVLKCRSFQQAIQLLDKRKNVQQFKIEVEIANRAQSRKYCSTFFQKLESLKFVELLDLKIGKSFFMYDFLCDHLVKALSKLNYLKELYLEFTTKAELKEYLMPKFERRLMKKNIHLKIHKEDTFAI